MDQEDRIAFSRIFVVELCTVHFECRSQPRFLWCAGLAAVTADDPQYGLFAQMRLRLCSEERTKCWTWLLLLIKPLSATGWRDLGPVELDDQGNRYGHERPDIGNGSGTYRIRGEST